MPGATAPCSRVRCPPRAARRRLDPPRRRRRPRRPVPEQALSGLADRTRSAARAQGYAVGWAEGQQAARRGAGRGRAQRRGRARPRPRSSARGEHRAAVAALRRPPRQLPAGDRRTSARGSRQQATRARLGADRGAGAGTSCARPSGADVVRRALPLVARPSRSSACSLHPAAAGHAGGRSGSPSSGRGRVVPDAALARGDAVVETDDGVIDLRHQHRPGARAGGAAMSAADRRPLPGQRARAPPLPLPLGRVAELRRPAPAGHRPARRGRRPARGRRAGPPCWPRSPPASPRGLVCLPLGATAGLRAGALVRHTGGPLRIRVGEALRGRVLDGLGRPIDGGPSLDHLPEVGGRQPGAAAR